MMDDSGLRVTEYGSLRGEMLQNKQYVFERPLVIIGAAGVAAAQLAMEDSAAITVLPPFLILVLCANLWFTGNRLRSNARIAGYIGVALEPCGAFPWVGWENALRLYREWSQATDAAAKKAAIANRAAEAGADSTRFYSMLLALHVIPAGFALAASLLMLLGPMSEVAMVMLGLTLVAAGWFVGLCVGPYSVEKMSTLIEEERLTWVAVLWEKAGKMSGGG